MLKVLLNLNHNYNRFENKSKIRSPLLLVKQAYFYTKTVFLRLTRPEIYRKRDGVFLPSIFVTIAPS